MLQRTKVIKSMLQRIKVIKSTLPKFREKAPVPTKITLKFALFSVQTMGLETLTIKTKWKTGHLHNAARARSNSGVGEVVKVHQDFMGWSCMRLVCHGTPSAETTRWDAAARLGTKWEHYTDVRSLQCGTFADLRIVAHTVAVWVWAVYRWCWYQPQGVTLRSHTGWRRNEIGTQHCTNVSNLQRGALVHFKIVAKHCTVCTVCSVCAVCTVCAVHILYSISHRGGWFAQCVFFLDIWLHCFIYSYNLIISHHWYTCESHKLRLYFSIFRMISVQCIAFFIVLWLGPPPLGIVRP